MKAIKQKCPGCGQEKVFRLDVSRCPDCLANRFKPNVNRVANGAEGLGAKILSILKSHRCSLHDLSERLDRSLLSTRAAVESLREAGHNIQIQAEDLTLSPEVKPGSEEPLIIHNLEAFNNQWRKFGVLGDNHLGSKHERRDVLNSLYDLYEQEGVTEVYNTGNWIEGNSRINYHDVKVFGLDAQVDYFIEHYPRRAGITTYYIAGDDHEGWFQQRERVEIGKYAEFRARGAGRSDLVYLGYLEADVELKAESGSCWIKIMHPGGGSAYALSYAPQKIVEAFQGGEKPTVLLLGHYHKFDYCYPREVHVVQAGCTVDQSIFMRKNKIQAMVGGCIAWLNQAPDGTINRFRVEWIPFYDRSFYLPEKRQFGLEAV